MSRRSLRPRKSQPNYAVLAGPSTSGSEHEPEKVMAVLDDHSSGSDFAPDLAKDGDPAEEEENEIEDDDMEPLSENHDEMDIDRVGEPVSVKPRLPPKRNLTSTAPRQAKVAGGTRHRMYTLPTPSVHHRHRAVPLYAPTTSVERLTTRPEPFSDIETTLTHGFTYDVKTTDRLNRVWGYNVGSGPPWEIVEDRAWFKEAVAGAEIEQDRRPIVYSELKMASDIRILSAHEAASYLPHQTSKDGSLEAPSSITCNLGPHGSQKSQKFSMYDTCRMSDYFPESRSLIFHPGAPSWGLDWCPIHPSARQTHSYAQYLAVAPFPSKDYAPEVGARVSRPAKSCIQIWRYSAEGLHCNAVLCIESGPAFDLKWCPLPSHDPEDKRLGLLGGTFEDGSFSLYAVPHFPADESGPIYVHLEGPLLRIELVETVCWSFDWANSEVIAIGTTNGTIAVYDIGTALQSLDTVPRTDLVPRYYIPVHQSAIRALSWIRVPPSLATGEAAVNEDPTVIASGGYDGMECMTDVREGRGSVINRTRDVINTMIYSPYAGGPITIDHENIVKAYSASPSMLGRGHTLLEPGGPVWCLGTSDLHPQLAVACADGALTTTNILRSTRRGGTVPFWTHKVYHLDYSRKEGIYRFLERFLPTEAAPTLKTGAWPREVGVHSAIWNGVNGLGCAGMLASATGSGLCRIENLEGRWMKNRFPYGSVARVRGEDGANGVDVEEEDSD